MYKLEIIYTITLIYSCGILYDLVVREVNNYKRKVKLIKKRKHIDCIRKLAIDVKHTN